MGALIQYEQLRTALRDCGTIDEARQVRDRAAGLRLYARQHDDRSLEVWTSEVGLRASIRIGELVAELESAQGTRTDLQLAARDGTKSDGIEGAGLSRRTAYRYQELAGGRTEQGQAA